MEQTSRKETDPEYQSMAISAGFNIYNTSISETAEIIDNNNNNETRDISSEGGNLS